MKILLPFALLFFAGNVWSSPCCGPVTEEALKVEKIYDQTNVESLWKNGEHVNWQTGVNDRAADYKGPDTHSHCSDFAASTGEKLGVHLLHPPEHPETFLATAQGEWLMSEQAKKEGWIKLSDMKEAQSKANAGELVIASFMSASKHKPGHIAILRPSLKSMDELNAEGPQIIQAGLTNYNSTNVITGFKNHRDAFPNGIYYFAHTVKAF